MGYRDILIRKGTIVTHDKTIFNQDILVIDGKIVKIATDIEEDEGCHVINAKGKYVLPGLVDMHCEICDPGYDFREEFESVGAAAIEGGYTSITCNPNTDPVIDNKAVVEYVLSKAKEQCPVNVYVYGAFTDNCQNEHLSEIGEMQLAGISAISDGDVPVQNSTIMRNILEYSKMFEMPVILHNEDVKLSHNSGVTEGEVSTQLGLIGAPFCSETTMVSRNILLAAEFGARIHLSHISTKMSVQLIKEAKKNNVKVTAETSPQYLSLNHEAVYGFNSMAKLNPPLRKREDVEFIKKAVADGTIDVISTDHKPNTIDSKTVEFELASFGMPGLETALSVVYTELVATKVIDMQTLVERMSFRPSTILTLNKGRIAKEAEADLVIFDPEVSYVVDSSKFKTKAKYSPYEGKTLKGLVTHTIIGGHVHDTGSHIDLIEDEVEEATE